MEKKNYLLALFLMVAGLQTVQAQALKVWMSGNYDYYELNSVDSVTFDENVVVDNHEWVDLGLPSGTLWATCNVGANSPEEYGDYFAWGETETKSNFSDDTYSFSVADDLTMLLPENDAATANWGSDWQMPSEAQCDELGNSNYTMTEWTTQNGVNGLKVTSRGNGKSIFLPAAGVRDGTKLTNEGSYGNYWTRSRDANLSGYPYYMVIYRNGISADNRRWGSCGQSVRPVRYQAPIPVSEIVLGPTQLVMAVGEEMALSVTVLPENADNKYLRWESSDETIAYVFVDEWGGPWIIPQSVGTCTITCSATDGSGVKAECRVRVWKADTKESVDLGLPSGTLWATCNIGANSPEEYGDYFAWGETDPKEDYSWSTYKYCNGSYGTMTRYCQESDYGYNGFTDDLTELLAEDDAATVNWGSEWQMPSLDQIEELYNKEYTTQEWTTQNGVEGRKITGKNGNSIFLPAAGYRNDKSFGHVGFGGHYWSHSLCGVDLFGSNAYYLLFTQRAALEETYCDLCIGCSVRPVRVENTVHVQEITLNEDAVTLSTYSEPSTLPQTVQLVATVLPENADNKAVKWESSNTSVAVVSEDGVVTATLRGTNPLRDSCTITCSALDGSGVKATCVVTVDNSAIVL